MSNGTERVIADAAARGLVIDLQPPVSARSLEEAAALLGIEAADIIKTLVVKRADGDFLFALIPGDRQLAWSKLRALVGVNRLQLPEAQQALAATGYPRGAITPLGSTTAWPVYADSSIRGRRVSLGAGAQGSSLFVDGDALLGSLDATVADISQPLEPGSPRR